MKKPSLLQIITLLGLIILGILFFTSRYKIAYIDSVRLVKNCSEIKSLSAEYDSKLKAYNQNIDTLRNEFERAILSFRKDSARLSVAQRKTALEKIDTRYKQYESYRENMQKIKTEIEQKKMQKVMEKVNALIKRYGKKHKYTIIFGANLTGNVVYANEAIDITDDILKLINNPSSK